METVTLTPWEWLALVVLHCIGPSGCRRVGKAMHANEGVAHGNLVSLVGKGLAEKSGPCQFRLNLRGHAAFFQDYVGPMRTAQRMCWGTKGGNQCSE